LVAISRAVAMTPDEFLSDVFLGDVFLGDEF
jgi:hypothetical protein